MRQRGSNEHLHLDHRSRRRLGDRIGLELGYGPRQQHGRRADRPGRDLHGHYRRGREPDRQHLTLGNTVIGSGAATPTLDVAGTLQFAGSSPSSAFLQGGIVVASSGLIEGPAELGASSFGSFNFVNNGTLLGNAGTNPLYILSSLTSNGTVLAQSGDVGIEGPSFSNLSGTTLTGGTYIVQGPPVFQGTTCTDSLILLGFNFNADVVVDAANIVLDNLSSDLEGWSGGAFQPLEQQLQTIAATGSLQLLGARGYVTSNALTDDGLLNLQGGSLATGGLTVGSGGLFEGFGVVSGSVADQGAIIANGSALDIPVRSAAPAHSAWTPAVR